MSFCSKIKYNRRVVFFYDIFIIFNIKNIVNVKILSYLINTSSLYITENKEKQNAVIRSLEIIGEAVKNIPQKIKTKYTEVPWKAIAGTRDKITHHYFEIDLELIWKMVKENLTPLKKQMVKIGSDQKAVA